MALSPFPRATRALLLLTCAASLLVSASAEYCSTCSSPKKFYEGKCMALLKESDQWQGLTLAHFSAQLECFVQDRGCAAGLCSPCEGGVRGCVWCFLVTDTAQVELRSGRV